MASDTSKPRGIEDPSPLAKDPAYILSRDRALQAAKLHYGDAVNQEYKQYNPMTGQSAIIDEPEERKTGRTMFYRAAVLALAAAGVMIATSQFEFNEKNKDFFTSASVGLRSLFDSNSLEVTSNTGDHEYYSSAKHKFLSFVPGYTDPGLELEYFSMAHKALGIEIHPEAFAESKNFNGKLFSELSKEDLTRHLFETQRGKGGTRKEIESAVEQIPSNFEIKGVSRFSTGKGDAGTLYVVAKDAHDMHYDFSSLESSKGRINLDVKIYSQQSYDAFVQAGKLIDNPGFRDSKKNHALATWADAIMVDDMHKNPERWNHSIDGRDPVNALELHYNYVFENSNKAQATPEVPKKLDEFLLSQDKFKSDPDYRRYLTDYRLTNGFDFGAAIAFSKATAQQWTDAQGQISYQKSKENLQKNPPPGLGDAEKLFQQYGHLLSQSEREAIQNRLDLPDSNTAEFSPK